MKALTHATKMKTKKNRKSVKSKMIRVLLNLAVAVAVVEEDRRRQRKMLLLSVRDERGKVTEEGFEEEPLNCCFSICKCKCHFLLLFILFYATNQVCLVEQLYY